MGIPQQEANSAVTGRLMATQFLIGRPQAEHFKPSSMLQE
jgi:hypothetical protein